MLQYFMLMGISFIFMFISLFVKINNKLLAIIYAIIVSTFAATRDLSIPDTLSYATTFTNLSPNLGTALDNTRFELGFTIFSVIIKYLVGNSYQIYFFIITLLNMMILMIGIYFYFNDKKSLGSSINEHQKNSNYSINYLFPLVIYFIFYGYSFNFITIRGGLSFSFLFLSLSLLNRNKLISLLLYAVSVLFHNGALIMLIFVPFLFKTSIKKKSYYIWLSLMPLFIIIGYNNIIINLFFSIVRNIPVLYFRFHAYLNEDAVIDQKGLVIRLIVLMLFAIILIDRNNEEKKYNVLLKNYMVGLTILSLFMNVSIIGRVVEMILAMVFVLPLYHLNIYRKNIIYLLILMICLLYFVISYARVIT